MRNGRLADVGGKIGRRQQDHIGGGERIRIPEEEQPSIIDDRFLEERTLAGGSRGSAAAFQVREVDAVTAVEPGPAAEESGSPAPLGPFPWFSLLTFFFGLIGQRFFEPPPTNYPLGYAFYLGAFILFGLAIHRREWTLAPLLPHSEGSDPQTCRLPLLIASVILGVWTFASMGNNLFTAVNVLICILGVLFFVWALRYA